jgi:uncharacterized protein YcnI
LGNLKSKAQILFSLLVVLTVFFTNLQLALAHVSVKPNQVGVGIFQTFTTSVPNEKEIPTIGIRLVIPENLEHVSPNVKPGWTVSVKKAGDQEIDQVTEITWTGGVIPEGQRDDFLFSAKSPAEEGVIIWKAYQTYQDGTVIEWNQDPNTPKPSLNPESPEGGLTPYSVTKVVNDLTNAIDKPGVPTEQEGSLNATLVFSVTALLLSIAAIGLALYKK